MGQCQRQPKRFKRLKKRVRKGEESKSWFRCGRFFLAENQWYFITRDGHNVGPFNSKEVAIRGLKLFIECVAKQDTSVEHAISMANRGSWEIVGFR